MEALGNAVRFVYLAQLDGNEAVCDVLKRLIELDVEAPEEKLVFEETNAGWKEAA